MLDAGGNLFILSNNIYEGRSISSRTDATNLVGVTFPSRTFSLDIKLLTNFFHAVCR